MRLLSVLIIIACVSPAYASDPLPESLPTEESIQSVLEQANSEYQQITRDRESTIDASAEKPAPQTQESKKDPTLVELAAQVDALRNKLVIERTTLLATQSPRKVRVNGSKTIFNYKENAVFEVTSSVEHVTDVQLKPGEQLTSSPTSGDTVRWNIAVMKSGSGVREVTHLIIKPLDEDVSTNLVVATDQRVYQLKLVSGTYHMPVVSWTYPEDFEEATKLAIKRAESQESILSPDRLNFAYKISDENVSWKPVRVFDDGNKTFIQVPPHAKTAELPALFLIEDGEPLLVNYRVKGGFYILDRLMTKAELRIGPDDSVTIEVDDEKNWFERNFL